MKYVVVIPARYQSSRLPGKPLTPLCGVPMLVRTWRQCVKAVPPEQVYVATEDARIEALCREHGIQHVMTPADCLTGTDRIAAAMRAIPADCYINVQGDEPAFNPDDLHNLIEAAKAQPDAVINGYCPIDDEAQFRSGTIPKVVLRPDGRLLYMSRAAIPTSKAHGFVQGWRQVCAYAFPAAALAAFAACREKTPLEAIEDIEILRFLELGYEVQMLPMGSDSVAVDTPEDIVRAEARIRELGLE